MVGLADHANSLSLHSTHTEPTFVVSFVGKRVKQSDQNAGQAFRLRSRLRILGFFRDLETRDLKNSLIHFRARSSGDACSAGPASSHLLGIRGMSN
jgi:hypothetical protein